MTDRFDGFKLRHRPDLLRELERLIDRRCSCPVVAVSGLKDDADDADDADILTCVSKESRE